MAFEVQYRDNIQQRMKDEYRNISGKTVILFATSSGYGFMNTAESVRQMENTEVY